MAVLRLIATVTVLRWRWLRHRRDRGCCGCWDFGRCGNVDGQGEGYLLRRILLRWWWEEGSDEGGNTGRVGDKGRKHTERVFHCASHELQCQQPKHAKVLGETHSQHSLDSHRRHTEDRPFPCADVPSWTGISCLGIAETKSD